MTELVPHRPPMLWIDEVLAHDHDTLVCGLTLRAEHPFIDDDGTIDCLLSLEWMAQAVAAWFGLQSHGDGKSPQVGYLIAVPQADFSVASFSLGDRIRVQIVRVYGDADLASFEGSVHLGETLAAHAQLRVHRPQKHETAR